SGVGIKVFIEGEEEVGSPHLPDFLDAYSDPLTADVILIADSSNWDTGVPTLTTSLRGLVAVTVEVRTLEGAQHSGMCGRRHAAALRALSRGRATLQDGDGSVAVEGLVLEEAEGLELSEDQARAQAAAVPGVQPSGTGSLVSRMWTKPAVSI